MTIPWFANKKILANIGLLCRAQTIDSIALTLRIGPGAVFFVKIQFPGKFLIIGSSLRDWHVPYFCHQHAHSDAHFADVRVWLVLRLPTQLFLEELKKRISVRGTFWLLQSSEARGWQRRSCHCTFWPEDAKATSKLRQSYVKAVSKRQSCECRLW